MTDKTTAQPALPALGAPFEGGFYGGGNIRIHDSIFAIVWAPKESGEIKGPWHPTGANAPGAMSCFDSMTNTVTMADAGSPIAKAALAANIGGYTDWCIPARDVLEMGYRHLKPTMQKNHASFQAGAAEAFEDAWYWSSTQYSETRADGQHFGYGYQYSHFKEYEGRCRFVRLIPILQPFNPLTPIHRDHHAKN